MRSSSPFSSLGRPLCSLFSLVDRLPRLSLYLVFLTSLGMDPVSAVGLVEASLGLALQFGSAAKTLNDVAGKYKNAKLTIRFLIQNLDILQLSWTQVGLWFREQFENDSLHDVSLLRRVEGFLETGSLVMEALEHDLQAYNVDHLTFTTRSKLIWNETTLQNHQSRIRDQGLSMSLFLQAIKL